MKARKDLVYTAVYDINGEFKEAVFDEQIITTAELSDYLNSIDGNIMLTGDGAEDFYRDFPCEKFMLAPVHLRLQSGAGVILASLNKENQNDDELQASYLQIVKAEKDLIKKQQC